MKTIVTCLFLMMGVSLTAQTKIDDLFGDWNVNSYIDNGHSKDGSTFYLLFSMTDDGTYTMSQVYYVSGRNEVCTATIKDQGSSKYTHQLISSSSSKPEYSFGFAGTYTYALNGDVLTITGENKKVVLQRK